MAERWIPNDMRDRQLLELARRDMDHYAHIVRIGDRLLAKCTSAVPDPFTVQTYNEIVRTALSTFDVECSVDEALYARLRTRGRMTHQKALAASGFKGRMSEELMVARKPVRDAMKAELQALADEAKITKDDVVQGLLNAVACAESSQDLTKAWREIGLLMGYYEETKINIKQHVEKTVVHRLEGVDLRMLSDEALMKHAGADMLRVLEHTPVERLEHTIEDAEVISETVKR